MPLIILLIAISGCEKESKISEICEKYGCEGEEICEDLILTYSDVEVKNGNLEFNITNHASGSGVLLVNVNNADFVKEVYINGYESIRTEFPIDNETKFWIRNKTANTRSPMVNFDFIFLRFFM